MKGFSTSVRTPHFDCIRVHFFARSLTPSTVIVGNGASLSIEYENQCPPT
jgi:hypothetical protein